MGVYIKDMEMPESCIDCDLQNDNGWCPAKRDIVDKYSYATCPLIPVPPHGRLVDADALRAKQQEDADLFQGSTAYGDKCRRDEAMNAVANIVNAPTIIPAEEGE